MKKTGAPKRPRARFLPLILLGTLLSGIPGVEADEFGRIALADVHYLDTSGEPGDRAREHAARVDLFETVLEERLVAGGYRVTRLACGRQDCSVGTLSVEEAVRLAERAGATYLLLGAIQKISTLIGSGRVDVVDLRTKRGVFSRVLSFRGDSDEAFRRAAEFAARDILAAKPGAAGARAP